VKRRRTLGVAVATVVTCAVIGASLGSAASAASGDSNQATPVIFVHGYDAFGTGVSCTSWNNITGFLKNHGFTGPMVTIKYYYNDSSCSVDVNNFGSQSVYFPGGTTNGEDNRNADIRHIGYQLAWYIYNTYSSKGQNVGLVGHSMGGLIVRSALYGVASGNSNFPPYLLVSNVVTLATPHNGTPTASTACNNTECQEMTPGSAYLADLNANGQNPQEQGGTDWTIMGSDADTTVPDDSAVSMTANHKVRYAKSDNISHLGFLNSTSTTLNAALSASDFGGAYVSTTTGEWPALRTAKALSGGNF
jgi:triacylglycerol esterase/lipase EstA (alpha/beta hydrolase family)